MVAVAAVANKTELIRRVKCAPQILLSIDCKIVKLLNCKSKWTHREWEFWAEVSWEGNACTVISRMMMEAAHRLNVSVTVLDGLESPASQLSCKSQVVGSFKNSKDIESLASKVDVLTIEIEHVDVEILDQLQIPVHPSPKTIKIIQDKFLQKEFLSRQGLKTADYMQVIDKVDILKGIQEFGLPLMLKSKTMAYDGKGNFLIRKESDILKAIETLGTQLYLEKFLDFKKELAVMVARDLKGNLVAYPTVETIQRDNICHLVIAPAQIDGIIASQAQEMAKNAVACFEGAGIFGVELFLLNDGKIILLLKI